MSAEARLKQLGIVLPNVPAPLRETVEAVATPGALADLIAAAVGEPIPPTLPAPELTALLHSRMQHLLERVQDVYGPHPAGEFWVPHRLGGGAPTLAEAARLDAEEASQRAAARAARQRADPAGASE